ncbi:TolC family protein [Haloferula sargassicola]|uniref:Uncharacterized protein n=1 Tax=Haloferula sargassicola TaxID=490096 RepID=A0ABP9UQ09_9BACT
MKTSILSVTILAASVASLFAGDPSISIVEKSSRGESKDIASIRADGDVERSEIRALYQEAKRAFPENRRDLFGPDAGFVSIELTDGNETMRIRSWHPLFSDKQDLVVTSHGVESLNGREREDVLKKDEAWYREARRVFDKILSYAASERKKDHGDVEAPGRDSRDPGFTSSLDEPPGRLDFSVEKNLVLSAIEGDSPHRFLSLQTMEFVAAPDGLEDWPDDKLKQWMMQNPETLILSRGRGQGWELIHFAKPKAGTRMIKVHEDVWEKKSIDLKDLKGMMHRSATPGAWGFITHRVNASAAFLFHSYSGVTYLWRVAEFVGNPGSVKLTFRAPQRERKTEVVPGKETVPGKEALPKSASPALKRAAARLDDVRKMAAANMISKSELLKVEEEVALLRAREEGSPAPAIACIKVRFARERLERIQAHFDAGIVPQVDLDAAQQEFADAEAALAKALNEIEVIESD